MPTFVVSIRLPNFFEDDFLALIPRHRSFVTKLLTEHIIESYAISADRSRGWITMHGETTDTIRAVVEQFPLFKYFQDVEIDELFIFDSVASRFPPISLN